MNITIPIYIEQQPQQNQSPLYLVRPLFLDEPVVRDDELRRAVAKFVRATRKMLDKAGKMLIQSEIANFTFAPDIEEHLLQLSLNLKERTANGKFLFVIFNVLDRRVAFTPSIGHLWFEIGRGETLHARGTEVLTDYFRNSDKQNNAYIPRPEEIMLQGKAHTGLVELKFDPPLLARTPREEFRAKLFGDGETDGEWELQSVGRCLNELYPDDLNHVTGREPEINELWRLLKKIDRRPILLVGPRMVGKTAIIEEYVYRRTARRKSVYANRGNVWLISPQRLISGMSYVGQWENRLLAILKEAKKRKHILYFDDLLGLFKAGISAQSNLNVAHVLKPYIERREIRFLGEITPEAWRVLRELDRGFADLFHLITIRETGEDETIAMMFSLIRELESKHGCRFNIEALPAVIDLARRYVRDSSFPGKAAVMLRQLAIKFHGAEILRENVLYEFHAKSGLSVNFLNDSPLHREHVTHFLSTEVVGQSAAVKACSDALLLAKARLNDRNRPLGTFLFLGPTGVGKTQCAKSLAKFLFSSEERLIRFDMNEFSSYDSVARLSGTFDQPDGLLTGATRRQPFAVILLDEIEKAHPDVFNLLLQVMGEGRLTDALGRTTDFTNAMIILTSNLGVKEASSDLGFNTSRANEVSIYSQAAEKFFSPEFYNRLDRIVPFNRLDRETVGEIARKLVGEMFTRDGVARRKIVLNINRQAVERIVDAGFHPQLGARALKREIEKQLSQPVARLLAGTPLAAPTIINILPGPDRLRVMVKELIEANPREEPHLERLLSDPVASLERVEEFLSRIEEILEDLRPKGPISIDDINPEHQRYFKLNELTRSFRNTTDWISKQIDAASRKTTRLTSTSPRSPKMHDGRSYGKLGVHSRRFWKEMSAAEDIHAYLREMANEVKDETEPIKRQLAKAIRESAMIEMLALSDGTDSPNQALVMIRSLAPNFEKASKVLKNLYDLFAKQFGFESRRFVNKRLGSKAHNSAWLLVSGWNAAQLASIEGGTHLFLDRGTMLCPVQVKVFAFDKIHRPREAIKSQLRRFNGWLGNQAISEASVDDDPWPVDPVIRIYAEDDLGYPSTTIDLRSGLMTTGLPTVDQLQAFVAASLTLPDELID